MIHTILIAGCIFMELSATLSDAAEVRSKDAVARWREGQLELATKAVVHRFDFEGGGLRRTRWLNRKTGVDLLDGRAIEDFALVLDGLRVSSADSTWNVAKPEGRRLKNGELQVTLTLKRQGLA
ncbi:MAG: hypothetical protein HY318_17670, partial [Armatimonadetes bacterium]|nr:hypothetical protein [Armatimonadota bacterium]